MFFINHRFEDENAWEEHAIKGAGALGIGILGSKTTAINRHFFDWDWEKDYECIKIQQLLSLLLFVSFDSPTDIENHIGNYLKCTKSGTIEALEKLLEEKLSR